MTRCEEFYEKIERDGNFCNMDRTAFQRTVEYIAFCREINMPLGTLSERAARPLIKEKNPVVKAKVIASIGKDLNKGRTPTAAQTLTKIQNAEAGKSNRGGDHKGACKTEEVPDKKFGDFVQPVETPVEEKDPDETDPMETDFIEVDPDEVEHITGDEDGDPGTMPEMPNEEEERLDVTPEPVTVTPDIEEDIIQDNPEITEKVVKERLLNAGHEDPKPKPKPRPTEDNKQALFDKAVAQALEWGMNGDEMFRRIEKAIIFALKKSKEES